MERKQETLTEKFANSIIVEANEPEETIKLEVKPKPIIKDDESFSNLATRVIDEVIANKSHVDVAKQVLRQAGIDSRNNAQFQRCQMAIFVMLVEGQGKSQGNRVIPVNLESAG